MVTTRSQIQNAERRARKEVPESFTVDENSDATEIHADAGVRDAARSAAMNAAPRSRRGRSRSKASNPADNLADYASLPDYLKDNEFITRYYRHNLPLKESLWSLFKWHNETGNVWTHLIGFFLFLCLTVYLSYRSPTPLAFGTPETNTLWLQVAGNLQQLKGRLSDMPLPSVKDVSSGLHMIQDSLSDGAHHLQVEIQHGAHVLQDGVQSSLSNLNERVAALGDQLKEKAHLLQDGMHVLSDGMHAIQDGMHAIQDGMHARIHNLTERIAHTHLYEALSGRLQWPTARWPYYTFLAGTMTCLLLSSTCHLLGCCKAHIATYVWRVDYAGIVVLVVTSFYPAVYYGFLCEPFWCFFYLAMISVFGTCGIAVSLMERFQQPKWRAFRASMFAGLGLYGVVPVIHQWIIHSDVFLVRRALVYDIIMGITYLTGAAIYALRVPERWLPGKFDLLMSSHQIFHVAVVAAAVFHYYSVMLMLEWRDASGGCAVPLMTGTASEALRNIQELGDEIMTVDEVWNHLHRCAIQVGMGTSDLEASANVCPA